MLSSFGEKKKKAPEKSMNCQKQGENSKAPLSALPKGYFVTYKLQAHITVEGKVICCNHF